MDPVAGRGAGHRGLQATADHDGEGVFRSAAANSWREETETLACIAYIGSPEHQKGSRLSKKM